MAEAQVGARTGIPYRKHVLTGGQRRLHQHAGIVQSWEDDLPIDEGCSACGYGGEEYVIIHFTTTAGNKAVMKHEISDFGEFIASLCYVREG